MKRISIALLTLLAMWGCTSERTDLTGMEELSDEIRVSSSIEGVMEGAATRAATPGLIQGNSVINENMYVAVCENTIDELPASADCFAGKYCPAIRTANGKMTLGTLNGTGDVPRYDKKSNKYTWIAGFYDGGATPTSGWSWTNTSPTTSEIQFPIGRFDYLYAEPVSTGNLSSPRTSQLWFKHCLAQVLLVCKAEDGSSREAIDLTWGNLRWAYLKTTSSYVQLNPKNMTYSYNTHNGIFNLFFDKDFATVNGDINSPIPLEGNEVSYALLVAPRESGLLELRISTGKFTSEAHSKYLSVQLRKQGVEVGLEARKKYTITLTFKAKEQVVEVSSVTIADWGTGYTGSGDITLN